MALINPAPGDSVAAADIDNIRNHLEGASGSTAPYHFRQSTGNLLITLATADGSNGFRVNDSAGVQQSYLDSDGNLTLTGSFTPGTLILPNAASPAQTTEASIIWDTDDDRLTVGTGSATKVIGLSRGAGSNASATQEVMYDTTNAKLKVWDGSASVEIEPSLTNVVQRFVESSGYKGFCAIGSPSSTTPLTGTTAGIGFSALIDATSATLTAGTSGNVGAWRHSTGATSGEDSGFIGPRRAYTGDWTLIWRGVIDSAASQNAFIGVKATGNFGDENDLIGFRVSGTGNIFGVCDSGGTETTRDSGATGATECTLRIEVRSAGTIVRFYRNNVQVGADVTTNIPASAAGITACGIVNSTTADKTMHTYDLYGWMEV